MLARKPPLVLLDEPFAGLDRQLVRELIDDLSSGAGQIGFSMIAVDHQAEVLKRLCRSKPSCWNKDVSCSAATGASFTKSPATSLLESLLAPL